MTPNTTGGVEARRGRSASAEKATCHRRASDKTPVVRERERYGRRGASRDVRKPFTRVAEERPLAIAGQRVVHPEDAERSDRTRVYIEPLRHRETHFSPPTTCPKKLSSRYHEQGTPPVRVPATAVLVQAQGRPQRTSGARSGITRPAGERMEDGRFAQEQREHRGDYAVDGTGPRTLRPEGRGGLERAVALRTDSPRRPSLFPINGEVASCVACGPTARAGPCAGAEDCA